MEKRVLIVIVCVMAVATPAFANLLVNGSFEIGSDPGPHTPGDWGVGNTSLTGWTVTADNINYFGAYCSPHADGSRSIDLIGHQKGAIAQTFTTEPETIYSVTFSLGGFDGGSTSTIRTLEVRAANQSQEYSFDSLGYYREGGMGWRDCAWAFTAIDTSTVLEFAAIQAGDDNGPFLDNVVVTPEPATLLLLGLGAVILRKRKQCRKSGGHHTGEKGL